MCKKMSSVDRCDGFLVLYSPHMGMWNWAVEMVESAPALDEHSASTGELVVEC